MFQIDIMSRTPVYEQIIEQMEKLVLSGVLAPDSRIPSVRNLSVTLSINPNTIQKAYTELDRRGLIYSVPGRGCFISPQAIDILSGEKRKELEGLKETLKELKLAGIRKEEVLAILQEVFEDGKGEKNQ